jgi:hypothetical protein
VRLDHLLSKESLSVSFSRLITPSRFTGYSAHRYVGAGSDCLSHSPFECNEGLPVLSSDGRGAVPVPLPGSGVVASVPFENSIASTSISKQKLKFSKLQRANGGCLGA